eukprot:211312-Pelagomonas_calceolata.AAC.1
MLSSLMHTKYRLDVPTPKQATIPAGELSLHHYKLGKWGTLAQQSRESLPQKSCKRNAKWDLEDKWKHPAPKPGCEEYYCFNDTPASGGYELVGMHDRMGMKFASKFNYT